MNKKNGSVLVTVSIVMAFVIVAGAIIFFWPKFTAKNGGATLNASSRENSYALGGISFVIPSGGTEESQPEKNVMKFTYPDGRFILAMSILPSRLSTVGTTTLDTYKSVLGSSNFTSNYAYYSYLLTLTTSSVMSPKSSQDVALKSALFARKNVSIVAMDSSTDISSKNQNGINGIERTTRIAQNSPLIEVFDSHDAEYTFGFNNFSLEEAEAVFASIQPVK